MLGYSVFGAARRRHRYWARMLLELSDLQLSEAKLRIWREGHRVPER